MNDYHKFGNNYVVEMDAWSRHCFPNYISITQDGVGFNGGITGVVASGVASSSTSEGTMSDSSGKIGGVVGEGTSSGPNGVARGGTMKATSRHIDGAGSGDTSNVTSSLVVDSLDGVASGVSTFKLIGEIFKRLRKNYHGVNRENLRSLQKFERKTNENL